MVDVSLTLEKPMATARPGLTAKVRIASDPLKNVLYVPRQAIFDKDGTSLVYVKVGDRFRGAAGEDCGADGERGGGVGAGGRRRDRTNESRSKEHSKQQGSQASQRRPLQRARGSDRDRPATLA